MKEKIPLESEVVKAILKWLKAAGYVFVYKTHGSAYQAAGLPDIVVIDHNGRFVGLECKRSDAGKLTALQAVTLNRITQAGGYAAVVTSVDEVQEALERSELGYRSGYFQEGGRKNWNMPKK